MSDPITLLRRVLALCLCAAPLAAQAASDSLAFAGPAGIYVWTGGTVVSRVHPVNGVVAHRVERRVPPQSSWQLVADVEAVSTAAEFFGPLSEAIRSELRSILEQPTDSAVWARILAFPSADSLAGIIAHDGIRRALGLYLLDPEARAGQRYQYRITDLDAQGRATTPRLTTPVAYPSEVAFAPVRTVEVEARDSALTVWWHLERGHTGRVLEIWRRNGRSGPFQQVDSLGALILRGDSLLARHEDRRVEGSATYQYFAVPRDLFFNRGTPSDTVTAYTIDVVSVAPPREIRVEEVDTVGLRLRWVVDQPERLNTIRVYRGEGLEGPWVQVAELPPAAATFTDPTAPVMQVAYYRLSATSPRGEESPPSAAVFGSVRSPFPPSVPQGLRAIWLPDAELELRWMPAPDTDLRGYIISRVDGAVGAVTAATPARPVGDLIPATDSVFVDSLSRWQPGRSYTYLIHAVNTSERRSDYSDPVDVTAPGGPGIGIPTGLDGRPEEGIVHLTWDDMGATGFPLAGYRVVRESGEGAGSSEARFEVPVNRLTDSTILAGSSYTYRVAGIGLDGIAGEFSASFPVAVPQRHPLPPGNIRAASVSNGIEIAWDEVEGADLRLRIYRFRLGEAPERLAEVPAAARRYLDSSAAVGVRWQYRIVAVRDGIEGIRAAEVSARR